MKNALTFCGHAAACPCHFGRRSGDWLALAFCLRDLREKPSTSLQARSAQVRLSQPRSGGKNKKYLHASICANGTFKASQSYSRPLKAIQTYSRGFGKKFILWGDVRAVTQPCYVNGHGLQSPTFNFQHATFSLLRPIPTYWDLFRTPSPHPPCFNQPTGEIILSNQSKTRGCANQPKSRDASPLPCKKTNQKPTEAGQKMNSTVDSACEGMACGKTPNHIKHLIIACLKRFSGQIIISHVGTFIALSTLIVDANDVIWPKAWILKI